MNCKAVIFDLFETLITEWGHKKYTKNEMCSDLGIEREKFDIYWDEKEKERYISTLIKWSYRMKSKCKSQIFVFMKKLLIC